MCVCVKTTQADLLSDRIAIMTAGKMACMGSSVFLKKRFGLGFSLTMVKTNDQVYTPSLRSPHARRLTSPIPPSLKSRYGVYERRQR